jgi:shikimate kinase (EC 2.7.1.71)
MKPTRIFLVGFMCSGKSTVGKLLADKLGYTFWDIDQVIEEREGKSIEEIFRDEGEEYFRSLERSVLEEFLKKERIVVSTGGGLGANLTAMEKMKSAGLVVWLDLDFETFLQRCAHQEGRPLLNRGLDYLRTLMEKREKVYRLAHIRLKADKPPDALVEGLLSQL